MAASACAIGETLGGTSIPKAWKATRSGSSFGDLALFAFLLMQGLDGFYTYLGFGTFGIHVEANPVVATLMTHFGHEAGLLGAKIVASGLGIFLYLLEIHTVLALLTGFYVTAAIAPWTLILFF